MPIYLQNQRQLRLNLPYLISKSKMANYKVLHPGVTGEFLQKLEMRGVVVVVVYFILSRLLYLAFSANLGLLCMPHPNMGPLV